MKKILAIVLIAFSLTQLWSQEGLKSSKMDNSNAERNYRIPLIGESAPSFTAVSTTGKVNFPGDYGRKWKILFSHPADFTPVCTSEILELANLQEEFNKLNVQLVVVSTDPLDTHFQWKKAMEELDYKGRERAVIKFPIVDDENLSVSRRYGMIHNASNSTKSVRGVFIVDPDNVVQAIYFYPMNVGRSTDELIRMVSALQATSNDKVLAPANWKAGNDMLVPYPPVNDSGNAEIVPQGFYNLAWFMWYKKAN